MMEDDHKENTLEPTLIRASAGTGKTYQLTARYLKLLIQGAAPESILATTFTRKAAGEILSRILETLAAASSTLREEDLGKIREQVGIPTLPRSCCLQLTEKLLSNIHRLRVSTLDSLFTQLAKSFPFELTLPATWRLTDEIEDVWLRERAVNAMISHLEREEIATLMSMLGKGEVRRSVSGELLQVIEAAYSQQRSCLPTVWNSVRSPKRPDASKIIDAVNAFRSAQPKQKRLRTKLESLAEVLEIGSDDELVQDTLVAKYAETLRTGQPLTYYRSEFPDGLEEAFSTLYAVAKSRYLSLLQMQNEGTGNLLSSYEKHIQDSKEDLRVVSFEDISVRLAELFRQTPADQLLSRVDGVIDHLLLDEFQDTSPVQWQVLYPFAARTSGHESPTQIDSREENQISRSFFCVGDTKQAIYGWRGGVAEIFDTVAQQLPGISEVTQNKSFRSSPVLMSTISRVFKNLGRHPLAEDAEDNDPSQKLMYEAKSLLKFADRFPEHTSANSDLSGYVQLVTSTKPEEPDAFSLRASTFETAARIAEDLMRADSSLSVGVLTRTNRAVAEVIYLLEQRGLDVSQEGGNPLTDSAAVEVVLSALMMAEHPGDRRWEFHVSGTPLAKIEGFGPTWVRRFVDQCGLPEVIEEMSGHLAPLCDSRETLRLKQLAYLALEYDFVSSPRLRDFVRLVREKRIDRPRSAPIRVMTVHQAKGLEFDAVIVVEMESPLSRSSTDCVSQVKDLMKPPTGLTRYASQKTWHFLSHDWQRAFGKQASDSFTESLCMWYVALTRAKQGLYMVVPPAKKIDFNQRTFGSLLFYALQIEEDPTRPEAVLFKEGDSDWFEGTRQLRNEKEVQALAEKMAALPIKFKTC